MIKGFFPPFEVLDIGVYVRIIDSKGELLTLMSMSENARVNARTICSHLNAENKPVENKDAIIKSRNIKA